MSTATPPSVTVHARSKLYNSYGPMPVRVDERLLARLYDRRQEDAAKILGMSLTSLKMACRRLGIKRWPYSRYEPSLDDLAPSSQPSASQQPNPPSCQSTGPQTISPPQGTFAQAPVTHTATPSAALQGSEWQWCSPKLADVKLESEWLDWYMDRDMLEEDVSFAIVVKSVDRVVSP
eukprot:765330-Hanusia_phi.AAC.2